MARLSIEQREAKLKVMRDSGLFTPAAIKAEETALEKARERGDGDQGLVTFAAESYEIPGGLNPGQSKQVASGFDSEGGTWVLSYRAAK